MIFKKLLYRYRLRKTTEKILIALLQNPERYKYITKKITENKITQEEANLKNIKKAFKIAKSFLNFIQKQQKF